jgi:hypothetical protein
MALQSIMTINSKKYFGSRSKVCPIRIIKFIIELNPKKINSIISFRFAEGQSAERLMISGCSVNIAANGWGCGECGSASFDFVARRNRPQRAMKFRSSLNHPHWLHPLLCLVFYSPNLVIILQNAFLFGNLNSTYLVPNSPFTRWIFIFLVTNLLFLFSIIIAFLL